MVGHMRSFHQLPMSPAILPGFYSPTDRRWTLGEKPAPGAHSKYAGTDVAAASSGNENYTVL